MRNVTALTGKKDAHGFGEAGIGIQDVPAILIAESGMAITEDPWSDMAR